MLRPYQLGLWWAQYMEPHCQLCGVYPSQPINQSASLSTSHPISQTDMRLGSLLRALGNSGLLCQQCHAAIHWLPTPFVVDLAPEGLNVSDLRVMDTRSRDNLFSKTNTNTSHITTGRRLQIQPATSYVYPIRPLISAFKAGDFSTLKVLLHVIRQLPRPHGCHGGNSVIIPMPTTSERIRKRGFDPVTILVAHLSSHWQIPACNTLVSRVDGGMSQRGLSRAERLHNLDHAFVLNASHPPARHLLLFDDVATTGASLQALANAILPILPPSSEIKPSVCSLETNMPANLDQAIDNATVRLPFATASRSGQFIRAYCLAHGS